MARISTPPPPGFISIPGPAGGVELNKEAPAPLYNPVNGWCWQRRARAAGAPGGGGYSFYPGTAPGYYGRPASH
ncbi:hypothetical protein PABY_11210 [Pyrodictium abyssi]|uniref:Uncharacterized protein n=1 Tax=Pyrodictium abyssi TaxID=54256 RepID=A0ABM8IVH8_9CREN|nr:hypothetical protein PABY_11210 [Pyrodictium abyssi]